MLEGNRSGRQKLQRKGEELKEGVHRYHRHGTPCHLRWRNPSFRSNLRSKPSKLASLPKLRVSPSFLPLTARAMKDQSSPTLRGNRPYNSWNPCRNRSRTANNKEQVIHLLKAKSGSIQGFAIRHELLITCFVN